MAFRATVILTALFLEDEDLFALFLFQHRRCDARAIDHRRTDRQALAVIYCQNLFKFDNRAGFTVEFFDRQNIVFGDAVLLTACFDHCVHGCYPLSARRQDRWSNCNSKK